MDTLPVIALWLFGCCSVVTVLLGVLLFLTNRNIVYGTNSGPGGLAEECEELMGRLERRVHQFERENGMSAAAPFGERVRRHREVFDYLSKWTQVLFHPSKRQAKLERLNKNLQKTLDELPGSSRAVTDIGGRAADIEKESGEQRRTTAVFAGSSERSVPETLRRRARTNVDNGSAEREGELDTKVITPTVFAPWYTRRYLRRDFKPCSMKMKRF